VFGELTNGNIYGHLLRKEYGEKERRIRLKRIYGFYGPGGISIGDNSVGYNL